MTQIVSVQGDTHYKVAVKKLAHRLEIPVAKLVREALDAHYGAELAAILTSLYTADVAKMQRETPEAQQS